MIHPGTITRRRFLAIAGSAAAAGIATTSAEPIPPDQLEELRNRILQEHNTIRAELKLPRFTLSKKLSEAAQAHAVDMAEHLKMTHDGSDGSKPADRIKARGYRHFRAGENVAAGRLSIERLMKGWMDSPVHKRNIVGGFSEIGVGCAVDEDGKRYWCVTFGLPAGR